MIDGEAWRTDIERRLTDVELAIKKSIYDTAYEDHIAEQSQGEQTDAEFLRGLALGIKQGVPICYPTNAERLERLADSWEAMVHERQRPLKELSALLVNHAPAEVRAWVEIGRKVEENRQALVLLDKEIREHLACPSGNIDALRAILEAGK